MAKLSKSISLALTSWLFTRIRTEAQRQHVSMSALIRTAMEKYLQDLIWKRIEAIGAEKLPKTPTLEPLFVFRTQAEKEYAEKVIQQHFDEDR
jgi:hypothetical protein